MNTKIKDPVKEELVTEWLRIFNAGYVPPGATLLKLTARTFLFLLQRL